MALADVQKIMARLFVDAPFRAAFFADPVAVGRSCGLDPAEAETLGGLSAKEVDWFAGMLTRKRIADIRKVLPLTAQVLGDAFVDHIRPAIAGAARPGRHRDDARVVAALLRGRAWSGGLAPPWAADLARYEVTFVEAARRPAWLLIRRFRYQVARLAVAILRGALPEGVRPRPSLGIWLRWPGRSGVFHRMW